MKDQISLYQRQYSNALHTIEKLQIIKTEIDSKLKTNPVCSHLNKELREINLDITITLNEIEHIETLLFEFNT